MKSKKYYVPALVFSGFFCMAVFNGCASGDNSASSNEANPSVQDTQAGSNSAEDASDSFALGDFSMQDIHGETYTQEMFAECDLTMVNVFTTWCTPCVREIPELEKLSQEMSDKGVKVVGIVLDAAEKSESAKQDVVEKAKLLAEETGAAYPFLIPDKGYMNGRLLGVDAVPETFFVDTDGNIVGEAYVGAHSLGDWKVIVEKELEGVKK